jgi:DNA-binding MarR family transcriptional regulator
MEAALSYLPLLRSGSISLPVSLSSSEQAQTGQARTGRRTPASDGQGALMRTARRLQMDKRKPNTDEVIQVAAFRAALREFLHESERVARANGLTPQRHQLLLMIKGSPDGSEQTTVTELTDRLKLAQSTITELVSRAEQAGLVERERSDDDLRVAHLRLTAEGERRLARVFTHLRVEREQLRRAFAKLDD